MVTECDVTDCTAPAEATAYSPRVNESFEYCSDHVKVMLDRFNDLELLDE